MVNSNLLTQHRNNRMRFTHPVFGGYLAGKALVNYKSEALLDQPTTDLLLLALKSGTEEERQASLSYLRMMPVEGVFGALYQIMYGGEPTLRDAVFQTFAEMAARGVDVPDPLQFGVGY
jgi:hypothetical protein